MLMFMHIWKSVSLDKLVRRNHKHSAGRETVKSLARSLSLSLISLGNENFNFITFRMTNRALTQAPQNDLVTNKKTTLRYVTQTFRNREASEQVNIVATRIDPFQFHPLTATWNVIRYEFITKIIHLWNRMKFQQTKHIFSRCLCDIKCKRIFN